MRKDRVMDIHNRETVINLETHETNIGAHRPGDPRPGIEHWRFNLLNPNAVVTKDTVVGIVPVTDADLTVSKITISLRAAANEIAGDLKYADALIGLANPILINSFDTTSGVLADDSITAGAVPAGKCVYLEFDSVPDSAITQALFDIEWSYD